MKKPHILDYLLQLLMVILGVFLGMWVSEWSSNKSQKKKQEAMLIAVNSELHTNLEYLKKLKPKQEHFFNSLDSLTKENKNNLEIYDELFYDRRFLERIPNWVGLGRMKLDDAMFEATKAGDILPALDIELLKQLSKTYSIQTNIDEIRKLFGQQFANIDSKTTYGEVHKLMWDIMQDLYGSHYNLAKEYKKSIEMIEARQ